MPSLKTLFNALSNILIDYHDFQFKSNPYPKNNTNEISLDKAEILVKKITEKASKKNNDNIRESFLNYILFILKTIHLIMHEKKIMLQEEKQYIDILQNFFITCKTLLNYQKNYELTVKYCDKIIMMNGIKQCKTAEILLKNLFISSDEQLQSFTLDNASEKMIKEFVIQLIKNHQQPFKELQYNNEINQIKECNQKQMEINIQLNGKIEQLKSCIAQLEDDKIQLIHKTSEQKKSDMMLQCDLEQTRQKNRLLNNENESLKEKILLLEEEINLLKITVLKTENEALKSKETAEYQIKELNEKIQLFENKEKQLTKDIFLLKKNNSKYFMPKNQYTLFQNTLLSSSIKDPLISSQDPENN